MTVRIVSLILLVVLLAVSAGAAEVRFVAPLDGSQSFGLMLIEIATDVAGVDRVEFHVDGVLAGVARSAPYRIAFDFGPSLDSRRITATVWSSGYQKKDVASVTTAAMTANETLNVDLVEVPLRVRSSRVLKVSDLRIRENGVEQMIRDVKLERPPAHFAFVVDRSLSMGDGRLAAALQAVTSELSQLREGDTASLVMFNHHVSEGRTIRPGDDLLQEFVGTVPSGGTSLRDALASIASSERTYAIVITDGGDRNSELSDEGALQMISGTRTIVSAIVLGSAASFLGRAAANTGGTIVKANAGSIGSALHGLLTDINSRYLVVYQSNTANRGWRSVEVKSQRSSVRVLAARKGYFAAP
jgi:hypothetical protein